VSPLYSEQMRVLISQLRATTLQQGPKENDIHFS